MRTGRSAYGVTADDILDRIGAREAVETLHTHAGEGPQWDSDPTPLSARWMRPPFPVDALPGWLADQVAGVAEATQTPPDLAGCIALAVLSAAAGGRAVVRARPGWEEPVNLYTVVAMPPGSRKSAVFAAMTRPLLTAEKQLADRARPAIADAELALRVAHARAERAARAAENATTEDARTAALAEASDAAAEEAQLSVPPMPRMVADDVTPEAAASLLAEQHGRLAVLSAEGGIFATLGGRYSGGAANLEVFLKGHAGDLLRVDRKGRPAEHVEHPALTLGLAVQPEVLRDIARMPGFRGRGLLARILYALPTSTVGRRKIAPPPVPTDVADAYDVRVRAMVARLADLTEPTLLTLRPEADDQLRQFEAELEPQLGGHGALAHVADWGSKLAGASLRITGLLHMADRLHGGWAAPIDSAILHAAIRIARYYLSHALAVFDNVMNADPVIDDARTFLDWISRNEEDGKFSRRDLFSGVARSRFPKVTDLEPALALLEQHGYIRRIEVTRTGPGRPTVAYAAHPALAESAESAKPP
jgi:replicative DNA helicase